MATETNIRNDFEALEVAHEDHGGLFKRKVSELMENKEVWEDLKRESRQDFRHVAKKLLKKSSIYAVSQVGHAESPYRKILWVLVLAAGLFGCCYEIHRFLALYFQYPVVVDLNVENSWDLEFPAVTVCNVNRMSRAYENCIKHNVTEEKCQKKGPSERRNKLKISERKSIASCSVLMSGVRGDRFDDRMQFLSKFTEMDSEQRKAFGYQLHDIILNCSYNGEECSLDNFSEFQSLQYGNCFTFNRRQNGSGTVLKTSSTGITNGLQLVLNLDRDSYSPVTPSVGARVVIHHPATDPNPEEVGLNISPGYETTLSMRQTCILRLPAPYKDKCINYENDTSASGKNQDECITICIQKHNYENCSCIDPTLQPLKDYRQCNITDATDVCCLDDVLTNMAQEGLPCECPLPCFSTKYDYTISTALWPSSFGIVKPDCLLCSDKTALQNIRNRHARLVVYYSSLERATFEQKKMFQNSELFSHLGGQMGLWLGLSLVAAFEIIENVIYIGKYIGTTCRPKIG